VYPDGKIETADKRLEKFVRDIEPLLEEYIPGKQIYFTTKSRIK
jgi:hypothetical protein